MGVLYVAYDMAFSNFILEFNIGNNSWKMFMVGTFFPGPESGWQRTITMVQNFHFVWNYFPQNYNLINKTYKLLVFLKAFVNLNKKRNSFPKQCSVIHTYNVNQCPDCKKQVVLLQAFINYHLAIKNGSNKRIVYGFLESNVTASITSFNHRFRHLTTTLSIRRNK